MYKLRSSLFLISLICVVSSRPVFGQVNGWEETIGEIPVIHVYGSDYEMGYALGFLDGDRWNYKMENDIISWLGVSTYEYICSKYYSNFIVPKRLEDIAEGVIDGISARPDSAIYSYSLGRDFNEVDFHISNSIIDICALIMKDSRRACSSLTAWETATAGDPELQGAPAMARNYDGSYNPVMNSVSSVIAMDPDNGNQTILCGWTLELDCSSGMNEYGICVTRNAGNNEFVSIFEPKFVPMGYAIFLGLIEEDFDSSGTCDLEDLLTALTFWNRSPSRIVHTLSPRSLGYMGEPAVVAEINNTEGYVFRYADDDSILTPDHLAATNHHRKLYPPIYCTRYELLQDSITADPNMTLDRFWWLMGDCSLPSAYTKITLLFLPETQQLGIAFADSSQQSWEKDPEWIEWDQLFPPEGIEGEAYTEPPGVSLRASHNPSCAGVQFFLDGADSMELRVFDITGRMVTGVSLSDGNGFWNGTGSSGERLPSGVYTLVGDQGVSLRITLLEE